MNERLDPNYAPQYEKSIKIIVVRCTLMERHRWLRRFGRRGIAAVARNRLNAIFRRPVTQSVKFAEKPTAVAGRSFGFRCTEYEYFWWRLAWGNVPAAVRKLLNA